MRWLLVTALLLVCAPAAAGPAASEPSPHQASDARDRRPDADEPTKKANPGDDAPDAAPTDEAAPAESDEGNASEEERPGVKKERPGVTEPERGTTKPTPAPKRRPPTAEERAEAQRYFEAGTQAYEAGQYPLAAKAFEEAYRRAPFPEITFSAAQAYRLSYYQDKQSRTLKRALELYERYLREAPRGKRRKHATMHIEAITGLLASMGEAQHRTTEQPERATGTQLMVTSRVEGARGRIDGGQIYELPFALRVEPGQHEVSVQAPGHAPSQVKWLAVVDRLVVAQVDPTPLPAKLEVLAESDAEVVLDDRVIGAAPGRALSVEPGEHVVRVSMRGRLPLTRRARVERGETVVVDARELEVTDQRVLSYVTLAGAGALAVGGAVTTALALAAEDRVQRYDETRRSEPKTTAELERRNADLEARNDFRTASYVLFGTATLAGVTGLLLWWIDTPGSESRVPPESAGLHPMAGPGMLGLGWATKL